MGTVEKMPKGGIYNLNGACPYRAGALTLCRTITADGWDGGKMNKDFVISWVHTPKTCSKDCEYYDHKRRVCSFERPKAGQKKQPCPYRGRR